MFGLALVPQWFRKIGSDTPNEAGGPFRKWGFAIAPCAEQLFSTSVKLGYVSLLDALQRRQGCQVQIRFTETTLSSLSVPPGMRDHQWFDAALPGFGFRKFASGQAAYFVRYRIEQKQRKVTLKRPSIGS